MTLESFLPFKLRAEGASLADTFDWLTFILMLVLCMQITRLV
jgi:hypothetical protein